MGYSRNQAFLREKKKKKVAGVLLVVFIISGISFFLYVSLNENVFFLIIYVIANALEEGVSYSSTKPHTWGKTGAAEG